MILGRLQVKVGPRHRLTAHVKLNSQGRARLRRARHHTMRVRVTVFSDGRVRRTGVVRVRL